MKNIGPIARAVLALTLSTAALAACGGDRNNNNNGTPYSGTNVVAFPSGNSCGQPLSDQGFGRYRGSGFRQYRMETNANSEADLQKTADVSQDGSKVISKDKTAFGYQGGGYGPGYNGGLNGGYNGGLNGGFGAAGYGGCGNGFIPACDTLNGGGGLTCVPSQGLPMGQIAGYGYGQNGFNYLGAGLGSCGYGGNCYQQIAQTCVIGMTNGCAQGACYPIQAGSGVGVCAIQ